MRKVFTILMVALFSTISFGQSIEKHLDVMEDKTYWLAYGSPIYYTGDGEGFALRPFLGGRKNEHGIPSVDALHVKTVGLGCVENMEMIILFEDGSKMTRKSLNKFNCDGNSYFLLNEKSVDELSTKEISTVRVTNGRNYKSHTIKSEDPSYFIRLKELIDNGIYTEK